MTSTEIAVLHRRVYSTDYAQVLGCRCGQKLEPPTEDAYTEHEGEGESREA